MSQEAIVLFAHGARDPEWAVPLADAVDAAAAAGARALRVVPLFVARGGHLKKDVPALIEAAQAKHPDCRIELAAVVGEDAGVVHAMAVYAAGA